MQSFLPIVQHIEAATGLPFKLTAVDSVSGGDINRAWRLQGESSCFFVKLNKPALVAMFAAEFAGLQALANTHTLRVPKPLVFGQTDTQAFIVMEWLDFGGGSKQSQRLLGQQLAQMHQQLQPYYGWEMANTIGSTQQLNTPSEDWLSFWRTQRLQLQLQLAAKQGYRGNLQSLGERLCQSMAAFFSAYQPQPSLLHGDLWGGNAAVDQQGNPVLFDPACYYGDREADLAMTELFGGFSRDFYAAYQEVWPLDAGYKTRKQFYNLYHILNHLNLFGGGYLQQAENMLRNLLSEIH